ncbi:hypothetical protein ASF48_17670 [Rathayibacter sp. Leaf299]|nr:hypothetical protein ASF48_17670 [Rathayibacter sp. Leaf299]
MQTVDAVRLEETSLAELPTEDEDGWGSVSTDLDLEQEPEHTVAQKGVRGLLVKATGGLLKLAPGPVELAELEHARQTQIDERTIRQATWTRAVSVLVANRKGGVGKTPTALCLGGTLAAVRGGSVAIVEVSDDPGALTFRAEGSPALGLGELLRDIDSITSAGQLAGYTAPQTSFASVIGSTGRRDRLTRDQVVAASALIDEFHNIRVMDSGNQPTSSAFHGAVETADVLVIPLLNAGDAALEALALLDELHRAGGHAEDLAKNAIIVRLTDGRPEATHVTERITRLIDRAKPAAVFEIPFDPHIAERGQITLDKLSPATAAAFTHLAAGVVDVLKKTVH